MGSFRPGARARRAERALGRGRLSGPPGRRPSRYPVRMPIDDSVRERVHRLVRDYLGEALPVDLVAEPVAIRAGTAVVYVRLVDAHPPVLRVFSPLLRSIERSTELLVELNQLNARLNFLRLFWHEGTVFAACELLAEALDAAALVNACDGVADTADHYDERLHARFGGELAFVRTT